MASHRILFWPGVEIGAALDEICRRIAPFRCLVQQRSSHHARHTDPPLFVHTPLQEYPNTKAPAAVHTCRARRPPPRRHEFGGTGAGRGWDNVPRSSELPRRGSDHAPVDMDRLRGGRRSCRSQLVSANWTAPGSLEANRVGLDRLSRSTCHHTGCGRSSSTAHSGEMMAGASESDPQVGDRRSYISGHGGSTGGEDCSDPVFHPIHVDSQRMQYPVTWCGSAIQRAYSEFHRSFIHQSFPSEALPRPPQSPVFFVPVAQAVAIVRTAGGLYRDGLNRASVHR